MYPAAVLLILTSGVSALTGHVVGPDGQPVPGAKVFLERHLGAPLVEQTANAGGAFSFDDVPTGTVGVFAIAPALAYGGVTLNIAVGDTEPGATIHLSVPGQAQCAVKNLKGKPISGARVTRAAILGQQKVSIPLTKLEPYGITAPQTNEKGLVVVGNLPVGETVALILTHREYAQEGVPSVPVGGKAEVTMSPGVLVEGAVLSQELRQPVANTNILFRNGQPPYDTTVALTDTRGRYAVRLRPGVYLYQAISAEFRSPAWTRLLVSGEVPRQEAPLSVAGVGRITGQVRDARTEAPIPGARLILEVGGAVSEITRTGPTGEFSLTAPAGVNILTIESAPGYRPPDEIAMRVNVTEGGKVELPPFWLAPIPDFVVEIIGDNEHPVSHAVVTMLRPAQFGWYFTGPDGRATIRFNSLPADGRIIGMTESADGAQGALFALDGAASGGARVQLLPLAAVKGAVKNPRGKPVPGAAVGAFYADPKTTEPILLWKTLSDTEGRFQWPSAPRGIPMKCVATAGVGESATGESASFIIHDEAAKDIGVIVIKEPGATSALRGESLPWWENPLLGGERPTADPRRPAIVIYAPNTQARPIADSLENAARAWGAQAPTLALVVSGPFERQNSAIPLFRGAPPGQATTYLVDRSGRVLFETFGLPPLAAVSQLMAGGER